MKLEPYISLRFDGGARPRSSSTNAAWAAASFLSSPGILTVQFGIPWEIHCEKPQ
jgi:hypothetical protein